MPAPQTPQTPQIYLITPPDFELSGFPDALARVLDSHPVACVRLSLASHDQDRIARAADTLRALCHTRDIALTIQSHVQLAARLGLDGVHLTDAARSVRDARKQLGPDAIIGTCCGTSRHDGMTAGDAGADYVSFGPAGDSALGSGTRADPDLFAWWSEMIELPVVAEGALTAGLIEQLAPITDFFGIGPEIWNADDPGENLTNLIAAIA